MTEEQLGLSRRLVACEEFRWVPGMSDDAGRVVGSVLSDGRPLVWEVCDWEASYGLPCLEDYATAAILLRLAMEAASSHGLVASESDGEWLLSWVPDNQAECHDLGTAAARALLSVWGHDE